jgi:uncharacterized protein (DUF1778 family)
LRYIAAGDACDREDFMATKTRAAKRETVNFRAKTADRNLIDCAARLLGKSRADFVVESARQGAQDALLDQTWFRVSPKVHAAFMARLDAPPAPNDKLRRMMTTRAPWEE